MAKRVLWLRDRGARLSPGLTINGLGLDDRMTPMLVDRRRGTEDWLLMHFPMPVTVHHAGEMRPFPAHTFFLWRPGSRHTFGNTRSPWSHWWMHCAGEVVERAVTQSGLPLDEPIAFADAYAVERHLEDLWSELTTFATPDPVIVESYVRIWIRALAREADPAAHPARLPDRLLRALRLVESRYAEPLSVADLARSADLSPSRFSGEFRAHLGLPPMAYLLRLRLQHAAHLLRDRNVSVAEVAHRVGFEDPFYFSRQFRRAYGASPLRWRQRHDHGGDAD